MKTLACCTPRQSVLDGSEDFVVNLSSLAELTESQAIEFLDSNVLTSGMQELVMQSFDRLAGGPSRGIFKLSESMGGGKTQSMIVAGLIAKYPKLAGSLEFDKPPASVTADHVIAFTGRNTDEIVWVSIGREFGVEFDPDKAPSEKQWAKLFDGKKVLILLDELAFYLVHAASQGNKEEGERFSNLVAIALTNLFGAVRDHKQSATTALVVADLQKDWEQGQEDLARIMRSNLSLGGTIQSTDNEMSKGAVSISPVNNSKDELFEILRKRIFKTINISDAEKKAIIKTYDKELQTAKRAGLIERALPKIQEEMDVSYPFHFSTKHLIETFNDNPGFQKTRDVIYLMSSIVRAVWGKGEQDQQYVLSLASPDFNDSHVAVRFKDIKRSLEGAMQTDIAGSGISKAEALVGETDGLSLIAAKWLFAASLSEVRPRGLSVGELTEYMAGPGVDQTKIAGAVTELYRNCWYIDQHKSGKYFFNRTKNLNAQLNSYVKDCSKDDRETVIEDKLTEMFEPKEKRCYQRLAVHKDFTKLQLNRDSALLVVCGHDAPYEKFFEDAKYKNRIAFLTVVDPKGLFKVNKHAERFWAIEQVLKDMTKDDAQWEKALTEKANIQSELFMAIRTVYARLLYPLYDNSLGKSKLADAALLDSYSEEGSDKAIKYDGKTNASKGELVVEATMKEKRKFQTVKAASGTDKVKAYQAIRDRVEALLFPSTGRAGWDQILEAAASQGNMVWTEPGLLDRLKDTMLTAGQWRNEAQQILKPPFEEQTGVSIEYDRNDKTGRIVTTDIKLHHGDTLLVSEDGGEYKKVPADEAFQSDAMTLVFKAEDSTGKNKTGQEYKIQNEIDLRHEFLDTSTDGHRRLKIGVVPPDTIIKWTSDGTDAANNGNPYPTEGIDVPEGATVKLFVEKGSVHRDLSISVPETSSAADEGDGPAPLDPEKPARIDGKALKEFSLVTRKTVHGFLTDLPNGTGLAGPRAKVVKAASDNHVAIAWDKSIVLKEADLMKAYAFLDGELPDAEWELLAARIVFPTGKDLIDWQAKQSIKISSNLITQ
ncbi:DUF499 domain-containing protein [Stieleria sp. TO1_6]|uniref:DUF499 domain-containing protein n=1 Tax=Stieleria tagensis TaxID=2956795 RepID=UPI00209B5257|nr:DUF499 domain-containing protein [Stieleria tagensis]MCO8122601.1 DUF499 domain-containing protein [Stieleria tagensis]